MKYIKINGKEYKALEFDFDLICDIEDMGINIEEAGDKPMKMVRAYIGMCMGVSKEVAGKEIQKHVLDGGDFSEAISTMYEMMGESDFFLALNKKSEEKTATGETTEK